MQTIITGVPLAPKTFLAKNGKEITLRTAEKNDLKRVKEFTEDINGIIGLTDINSRNGELISKIVMYKYL